MLGYRRECLGRSFADVSMMTTLAVLLANFSFRLADNMRSPEEEIAGTRVAILLHPRNGVWVHALARSQMD